VKKKEKKNWMNFEEWQNKMKKNNDKILSKSVIDLFPIKLGEGIEAEIYKQEKDHKPFSIKDIK